MKDNELEVTKSGDEARYRVRLPGFISEEEIGLGDLAKRVTSFAGIKPCGGCQKRAASLNRWMTIGSKRT